MHKLEKIADDIRKSFDVRTKMRDEALALTRQLTRACSLAIRGCIAGNAGMAATST